MAYHEFLLTNRRLGDLNPLVLGHEDCRPGHSFGPAVRDYTLIHYVFSGRGVLYDARGAHPVEAGSAFLIRPGEVTTYTADTAHPWHYCWFGFDGALSADFAKLPPVIPMPEHLVRELLRAGERGQGAEYELAALLLRLYARLFVPTAPAPGPVLRVEDHIRSSYMTPIRVEELARRLNMDRRYLSRLFRSQTGLSIRAYLTRVRLERAREYLERGHTVKEAAALCGWEDISGFSRRFAQEYGCAPGSVRK